MKRILIVGLDRLLAPDRLDGREFTLVGYGADLIVESDKVCFFAAAP